MTNEALVSYSRLTLDNHFKDPSLVQQGAGGITFNGIFPAGDEPVSADRPAARLGRQRPGRQPVGRRPTTCTPTTTRCSSATS